MHGQLLHELNWAAIAPPGKVRVIIPLVVIDELDEKSYGSKDDGEKARGALKYVQLRRDRHGADEAVPLDVTLPDVTLQLLVDRPGHEPRSNRDQEFLEHARYVAALTEQKVVVLTTDYGTRLRATATNLEWCVIARRAGGRPDPSESSLIR